jgi:hypothetical protein
MSDLVVWLLVGGLIAAAAVAMWKVFLVVAPIALVGWLVVKAAVYGMSAVEKRRAERSAVIARAEHQHNKLMSGDETVGTFGDYLPAKLDTPRTPKPIKESAVTETGIAMSEKGTQQLDKPSRVGKSVRDTGRLEVDFVGRTFYYTDSKGQERKASFPMNECLHPLDPKHTPCLNDLAKLLASARGWSNFGGQNEWWRLAFDDHATEDESFGVEVPNSLTLELTGHNPRVDFDSYISLRGTDPILWGYGRAKGQQEEGFSHVGSGLLGLRFLYNSVVEGLQDGEIKGYFGNTDVMFMRVIYREAGENEFEIRMPCRFEKPQGWTPTWE